MPNVIVKYELSGSDIPEYVIDGGYFPSGSFLYGSALDSDVPTGVTIVSNDEFKAHVTSSDISWPGEDPIELTSAEKLTVATEWISDKI